MDQHEKNARKFFDMKPFAPREAVKIHFLSLPSYDQLASRLTFADPSPVANLNPADFTESVKNAETLCVIDSLSQFVDPALDQQQPKILKGKTAEGQFQLQGELRVHHNALKLDAKQHKKRRNQSESYHKRIQKKWNKQAAANNQYQPVVLSLSSKINDAITKLATTFNEALYTVDKP